MINVVNIKEPQDFPYVYIGRRHYNMPASPLGNPFKLPRTIYADDSGLHPTLNEARAVVVGKYKAWLWSQMKSDTLARRELYRLAEIARDGHLHLGCWCKVDGREVLCHGDVIKAAIEYINSRGVNK